jgi:hypothetical protein
LNLPLSLIDEIGADITIMMAPIVVSSIFIEDPQIATTQIILRPTAAINLHGFEQSLLFNKSNRLVDLIRIFNAPERSFICWNNKSNAIFNKILRIISLRINYLS